MKKSKNILLLILLCGSTFFASCKKKGGATDTDPDASFDKVGMLNNIGLNVIIPAYADFKIAVDSLHYYKDTFIANPTLTTLVALQNSFLQTYIKYQWISTFEFGPADSELLRANFNTFPCDTLQINSKIAANDMNLGTVADLDAKGLPALDFLLFRSNQNNDHILSRFTSDISAAYAKDYLSTLINELKSKTDIVNDAWSTTGGNYLTSFKNSIGRDVGSSTGLLINQLNFDLELLKNAKIGIPLGKKTAGAILPEKVEAYYSTQSLALVIEHIKSLENIYLGRSTQNVDGIGIDDYLVHLQAPHASGSLNNAIKNKFIAVNTKLAAITGPLSQAILNDPTAVDLAYSEILQLVVLLKVDVPAATGILITYADTDGD